MVSRRIYFTITVIMAIVFFLFQSLNAAKEHENDYMVNAFAEAGGELPLRSDAYTGAEGKDRVVFIGGDGGAVSDTVTNWCLYTKRTLSIYGTTAEYDRSGADADILLLDGGSVDSGDADTIYGCTDKGTTIIFCGLPETSVIAESETLRKLLGIKSVRTEETPVAGLRLYPGLLLGGEAVYKPETESDAEKYQDLSLDFPRYGLAAGTKAYLCGIPEDGDNEEYPPVIWRNSCGNSMVFAVNGDYIAGAEGLGILTGFMAEAAEYELYPVVNAQNIVIANCPALADENPEKMDELYSRDMSGLFRDVIMPSLRSLNERYKSGTTFMLRPRFDYSGAALPKGEELAYFLKEINEMRGEAGCSMADTHENMLADAEFFRGEIPDFEFTSMYGGDYDAGTLDNALSEYGSVRTVVSPYDGGSGVVGRQTDHVTRQTALADGFSYTYGSDLRVRSVMSALGYSCVLADMERIAYPETNEDSWEKLSEELSLSMAAYPECYDAFDGTTLTQSDKCIRSFLALDYRETVDGDRITIEITGTGDTVWFILRVRGSEVKSVTGGGFTEIEDGAYLIEVRESSAVIQLSKPDETYYFG